MAYIETRKLKSGKDVYRAHVQASKQRFSATFERKTDARNWAEDLKSKYRANPTLFDRAKQKISVADAIERYCRVAVAGGKRARIIEDRKYHLNWWLEQIGELQLSDLNPSVFSECKERLLLEPNKRGALRSPATVNRYLAAISHVLSVASREWMAIDGNPAEKLYLEEPRGRVRYLEHDEVDRIRLACRKSKNKNLESIFLIAIFTGMRRGEILKLKPKEINLQTRLIKIEDSKNDESRSVPISDSLLPVIDQLIDNHKGGSDKLFFPSPHDPCKPVCIKTAWLYAVDQSGVTDYRFHDNRHTAASYLAMSGASDLQIADILGHKTLSMVKRYSHLRPGSTLSAVNLMNESLINHKEQN